MSIYFRYFLIISPWKRAGPFIWTNLNPLHPRMLCAKFDWNWSSGSGEEDENVKSLQTDRRTDGQTDRQTTDDRWSEQLTWAFSSGELKTCNQSIFIIFIFIQFKSTSERTSKIFSECPRIIYFLTIILSYHWVFFQCNLKSHWYVYSGCFLLTSIYM